MKRGLSKLTTKELSLLNLIVNGKVVRSFYSDDGDVMDSPSPSYKE